MFVLINFNMAKNNDIALKMKPLLIIEVYDINGSNKLTVNKKINPFVFLMYSEKRKRVIKDENPKSNINAMIGFNKRKSEFDTMPL